MLRQRESRGECPKCERGELWKYEDENFAECLECGHKVTYGPVITPVSKETTNKDGSKTFEFEPDVLSIVNKDNSKAIEAMQELIETQEKAMELMQNKLDEAERDKHTYEILLEKQTEKTNFIRRSLVNNRIANSCAMLVIVVLALFVLIGSRQTNDVINEVKHIQYIVEPPVEEIVEVIPSEEFISEEATEVIPIEERELVTRVVAAEARGQGIDGMMAVAQVIKDRSELWGMTPTQVVMSPGQFASPYSGTLTSDIHHAVSQVFDEGATVFDEPVTHFYSGATPYWAEYKINRGTIRDHTFLY